MSERFFVEPPIAGPRAILAGDEARHLARVMRAAVGDEVLLLDGSGVEFLARIDAIGKSQVVLEIIERRPIDRELPFRLTLAVALPKGERQKWLVEKATELGVTRLVPLITQRGVAQPVDAALARLRRGVIEASKQCGRNRLMEIAAPAEAAKWFAEPVQSPKSKVQSREQTGSGVDSGQGSIHPHGAGPESTPDPFRLADCRLIADPTGGPLAAVRLPTGDVMCAIGPEGGFTAAELAAAVEHGWQPVSLGRSILRVETAAVAVAAWAAVG
jgi:16S rRNA (uracil1498-N3)-methyltransferase